MDDKFHNEIKVSLNTLDFTTGKGKNLGFRE